MSKKTKKRREGSGTFRNNLYMLGFIAKNSPGLLFGYIFFDVLTNVPWILSNVVLLKYIIDVVTSGVDFYRAGIACGIFAAIVIIGAVAFFVVKKKKK